MMCSLKSPAHSMYKDKLFEQKLTFEFEVTTSVHIPFLICHVFMSLSFLN